MQDRLSGLSQYSLMMPHKYKEETTEMSSFSSPLLVPGKQWTGQGRNKVGKDLDHDSRAHF